MKPLWLSEDHTFSVINQTKKALATRSMNKGILSSLALSPLLALNPATYDQAEQHHWLSEVEKSRPSQTQVALHLPRDDQCCLSQTTR
jgi:hypothetical protein